TAANTSRAAANASASALPMPTAWLPWPGNTNAIDILGLPGGKTRRETMRARACQGAPLAKPLPCGLPRHAERRADLRPAHLARTQEVHDPLQLIALALDRVLDRAQPLQQPLGRQFLGRKLGGTRRTFRDVLVTEAHALVADKDRAVTRNQL